MQPDPHYTNTRLAKLYDLDSPWGEDTDFYVALVGDEPARVLDVGCGTGTLCIGLAERGHEVTGVDPAAAMLEVAAGKTPHRTVRWQAGTAQTMNAGAGYDWLLMTGHAFQTLQTDDDIQQALRNFYSHLTPGGRLAFESRNPAIDWNRRWPSEFTWHTPDGPVKQTRSEATRHDEFISFFHTWQFADEALVSHSTLRMASHARICELARQAGFELEALFGDWNKSVFEPADSPEMIFVFRR